MARVRTITLVVVVFVVGVVTALLLSGSIATQPQQPGLEWSIEGDGFRVRNLSNESFLIVGYSEGAREEGPVSSCPGVRSSSCRPGTFRISSSIRSPSEKGGAS